MCLCRCRDNHHFTSWLFKPWEAWDKYIPSPAPSFHQRDETVWVILLPLALISEEQYGWELNVPTFQKRVRSISCLLCKKKRKERKKYGTEVWILFHPVLPHWICQTNNAWLTAAWIVERRGEGLPLIVRMCICSVLFFHDSLLMMMTAADPRGRRA